MPSDFKAHLRRQLGFLELSCSSYDAGHTYEGIRIATVARVLIHNTKNSTSLLTHLGAHNIALSSTVASIPPIGTIMFGGMGRLTFTTGPTPSGTWKASTSSDSVKTRLSASDWWSQIVYVLRDTRLSRKDLVLSAADKDGGAHVDATLTPAYETLITSGERGFFYYPTGDKGTFTPIMDAHLVYLRQIGHELLNSPELLVLAS